MEPVGIAYSCATHLGREGHLDTIDTVRYFGSIGLSGVEVTADYLRDEEVDDLRAVLSELGMKVACHDIFCDVVTASKKARQARIAQAKEELRRATQLGAEKAIVVPGPPRDGFSFDVAREWFIEALRELAAEASRLNLTVMIENLGWQPVVYGTSEQLISICDAVGPELKVTCDVGNFLLAGDDNLKAINHLLPRIDHVHFKDWLIVGAGDKHSPRDFPGVDGQLYRGTILGQGIVNLEPAITELKRLGYQGTVAVDYEGIEEPRDAVRRGVAWLRSHFQQT